MPQWARFTEIAVPLLIVRHCAIKYNNVRINFELIELYDVALNNC